MGERSSIDSMDFEDTDVDKFLIAFMAEKVAMDKDLHYEFESLKLKRMKNLVVILKERYGSIGRIGKFMAIGIQHFVSFLTFYRDVDLEV